MEPIFLQAVLQDKIWGGTKLRDHFNFDIPSDTTGEAWVISAHPNGVSQVTSPAKYSGLGLDELYDQKPELFGPQHPDPFPLLVKILDAKDNLSVQVHPDDSYAQAHVGQLELGKTECWYVIDAEPGAKIIYGHQAQDREEFDSLIEVGAWDDLLTEVPVKAGDFFDVPAGTIHAIGAGVTILETQQSSDTTYRVYDYDRLDDQGQERDLHIQESGDVTLFPHRDSVNSRHIDSSEPVLALMTNEYFTVYKLQIETAIDLDLAGNYQLCTVISGNGVLTVDGLTYEINLADSFIIPYEVDHVFLDGDLEIIMSQPNFPHA